LLKYLQLCGSYHVIKHFENSTVSHKSGVHEVAEEQIKADIKYKESAQGEIEE